MQDPVTCIRPGAITPEDLIAYADGEAHDAVIDHVRICPACAAEARAYARAERRLRLGLLRFDCPSPQTISDYQLDLLDPSERQAVAAHLVECPRCADELRTLRDFLADRPAVPNVSPVRSVADRLKRVVATLVPPPGRAAYAGLRGDNSTSTQTYQAGAITITIGPGPVARRGLSSLAGLIWQEGADADAFSGRQIQLIGDDEVAHRASVDELGNFEIEDVRPGAYRLELLLPEAIVVVELLRVGS